MCDIYTYCMPMPARIKSFVRENPDGSYTIVLNDIYSYEDRLKRYAHEVAHIMHGDLNESDQSADEIESKAHRIIIWFRAA